MSDSQITFRAIAPIYSPLCLHIGVDQFSKSFVESLQAINVGINVEQDKNPLKWHGKFLNLSGQENEQRQYQSTDRDSKDIRLMCWVPNSNDKDNTHVMFHVFTNHITIVEVEFTVDISSLRTTTQTTSELVTAIEEKVQQLAEEQVAQFYDSFCQDIQHLKPLLSHNYIISNSDDSISTNWVARTMIINDDHLLDKEFQHILTAWLKKTGRPEDAADIIAAKKNHSMTWLNYVVKDVKCVGEDPYIQVMVLAQYYYISQEHCNSALRSAIEIAYAPRQKQKVDKVLANTRTACRLNKIAFYENIKFLSQPNRVLLEDILNGWKFEQLVENSERMVEICNARLQEEDNKKRERSTVMTDFLLVTLSFFAVFELSLYLTEFSREMMSRPALDYNDNKSSFFLSIIAEIDADIMFSFGFGLTLLLIMVYRYIKRN